LVLTPAALALLLRALERPCRGTALAAAAVAVAAVVLYPFALLCSSRRGRTGAGLAGARARRAPLAWNAGRGGGAGDRPGGHRLGLRSLRPPEYFVAWVGMGERARLLETARRHIIVLSESREWYMVNPRELQHPLVMAALAGTLLLLPHARRSRGIALVCSAMLIPPALTLNPLTASLLGRLVTPWALPRLLWALPVPLAVAALSPPGGRPPAGAAPCVEGERRHAPVRAGRRNPGAAHRRQLPRAACAQPRDDRAGRARADALHGCRAAPAGAVIAPAWLSVRVPSWSSRFFALPGPDLMRIGDQARVAEYKKLYRARRLDADELLVVRRIAPHVLVIAAGGSRLDRLMSRERGFQELHRNRRFALHQFRAELWPQSTP
jgi:hypothetical protein